MSNSHPRLYLRGGADGADDFRGSRCGGSDEIAMCYVTETHIKQTRKPYRCEWCWQKIEAGAECYRQRGIAEGQWFIARLHPECRNVAIEDLDYCETYAPGSGDRPQVATVSP